MKSSLDLYLAETSLAAPCCPSISKDNDDNDDDDSTASLSMSMSDNSMWLSATMDSSVLSQPDVTETMDADDLLFLQSKQDLLHESLTELGEFQPPVSEHSFLNFARRRRGRNDKQKKEHTQDRIVSSARFSRAVQALHVSPNEMQHLLQEAGGLQSLKAALKQRGAITNSVLQQNLHLLVRQSSKTGWIRDVDDDDMHLA